MLSEALGMVEEIGERNNEARLYQLKGELLRARGADEPCRSSQHAPGVGERLAAMVPEAIGGEMSGRWRKVDGFGLR